MEPCGYRRERPEAVRAARLHDHDLGLRRLSIAVNAWMSPGQKPSRHEISKPFVISDRVEGGIQLILLRYKSPPVLTSTGQHFRVLPGAEIESY